MKRLIAVFLVVVFALLPVSAAEAPQVSVNGQIAQSDVPARIENGRMLLPLRTVFTMLGATVEWFPDNQLIMASCNEKLILMQIEQTTMVVQNLANQTTVQIALEVPPRIYENRTLVPVRAISEALGATVTWDSETSTANISFGEVENAPVYQKNN